MELGLDISTVAVAVIAGIWTIVTAVSSSRRNKEAETRRNERQKLEDDRKEERQRLEDERQRRQDVLDLREFRNRDAAEAVAIHQELSSPDVLEALLTPDAEPARSYLAAVHERMDHRVRVLAADIHHSDDEDIEPVKNLLQLSRDRLAAISIATTGAATQEESTEKAARDFTKYSWNGLETKFGKGGILSFIGATFARRHGIATTEDFIAQFGDVVEAVLKDEIAENTFDRRALITPLLFDEQRERYAIANRRWRDAHGKDGVMHLDGTEYLVSWSIGFKGAKLAPLQKKLIAHFAADQENYPIVELGRG